MLILTYLLHGAESFLRSQLVLQLVKKFPAFLEPEGSSPYSQVAATCPYPEPTPSSPYNPSQFLKIHLNIILRSASGSPQWTLSLRFPHQNPVQPSYAPHALPISFLSFLPPAQYAVRSTDHQDLHYVIFSIPRYLVPLRPKYSPQHPILKHPQPTFLPQC